MRIKNQYIVSLSFSILVLLIFFSLPGTGCKDSDGGDTPADTVSQVYYSVEKFCMGNDLSIVNQVEEHGGAYADSGVSGNPYTILRNHGANLVRLRLWHNPEWTKEVYGTSGTKLYNDLKDVEAAMIRAKQNNMEICLDIHYSDTWADAGNQQVPAAWADIRSLDVLKDSVYNYTYKVLNYLKAKGLMPYMVQIGNEINCGICYSGIQAGFPGLNGCNGQWSDLGSVINSAIKAVRDASAGQSKSVQVALHIADPGNAEWFFDKITTEGAVSDFDIIGYSYYPLWHTSVKLTNISYVTGRLREKFDKKVMILETAYPWTLDGNDNYTNLLGGQSALTGYPYTPEGQFSLMKALAQEVIDGGGTGIVYWEPAWISSQMKDLWGTGSSWENATFFDFNGNTLPVINYMNYPYNFPAK
ncbi:MAG TPA: glycosyl hydrolase 53 family protein [Bacteroidales bacterium]|jgi:arabinogalactan endo-1,4-beta-galactosidase|nr:glycosyl hydrolase 53 family protein [Bacteroidales bacterium]